ncbi:MAG: Uma2 family endonuclease [Magnetococcales bacterium]|nr:Uma2 family endonuclease [Magnetococcales bacterium]MBF0116365.1 Uma2 family endonuclease [Magnetococcales bacterium]
MALQTTEVAISEEAYLRGEPGSEIKHEYIDGHVYAMGGAGKQHNRLTATLGGEFRNHLKGKPCDAYQADFRVKVGAKYFYPDVVVECDSEYGNEDYTETPIMLVEVTSDSTEKFDRTYKLEVYKTIPSLREYVIVAQNRARVDVYKRDGLQWGLTTYRLGDTILFESIGLTLTVEEIYDRVDNEDMREYLRK